MNETLQHEYAAAIAGAGLVRLRDWSTVWASGGDRASFLHNMCTNDVKRLTPGDGCEAFFTDVKGKIHSHGFLLAGDNAIQIVAVPGTAERLMPQLDRYIIREDVTLADESAELTWLLAFGERAGEIAAVALGAGAAAGLDAAWSHRSVDVAGAAVTVVRCELLWTGGFLLGCSPAAIAALEGRWTAAGGTLGGEELWQTVRIESAWPMWGVDFDATNLPQEVSRDAQAISFRKGCYLGQETVARLDALGHVNKQLVAVAFAEGDVPPAGTELSHNDQPAGRVTSSCWSLRVAKPQAIAMVKRGAAAAGSTLQWSGGAGSVAGS
ncbi:YgfZ/GcvT domain-containing protein [Lacipirellula parvula]|uniref:tRNA-modifying protein YgfZ n=1 Tax=Lacipirellula parvula TaxID=2650471 RepID=A0A5K7XBY1_9BACT|nr:glycine cleavage T C-terminal barrel domain-containing protein [Lacipirellula parvula]BBO31846.1 tRNA-modifying protein YgfZ [Lacipirellula parvula]